MSKSSKKSKADPETSEHPQKAEHERVTKAGEEGLGHKRTKPEDLEDYSGSYKENSTGEVFSLQIVPDDPEGKTHHLKNEVHSHHVDLKDFRRFFEKK